MASVRVRTRRRSPNANAPLSVVFTPNKGGDQLAAQASSWNTQLALAEDLNAMRKLSDGHTDQFMEFAKQRITDPELTAEQRAYWSGWLKDSERKVAEETLAAEVDAGTKKLEDVRDYTSKMLGQVGPASSEYPKLVKQLADIKQGILARDFNSEIAQAQFKLVETGNRQGYLETLQGIATRTRSTEAQQGLAQQMATLRTEIEKEKTTARSAQANKRLVGYYEGEKGNSRAEIIQYLQDMAETAGSTAEANHYTTLAAQIDTRERTLQRQALSDASSAASRAAGSNTKALEAALYDYEEGYKGVDAALVVALRGAKSDRGPLEDSYNTFEKEAADYEDALLEALTGAQTVAARKAINTDLNALRKNVAERQKQVSSAVTDNILENATDLIAQANESDDPDLASQFRFIALRELGAGLKDELAALDGDQIERLKKLEETAQRTQRAAIEKEAKILAGGDDKGRDAVTAAFDAYQDHYRRANASQNAAIAKLEAGKDKKATEKARESRAVVGPMADFNAFLDGLESGDLSVLGLSSTSAESAGMVSGWSSNIAQAEAVQAKITAAARTRLNLLVTPRDSDGKRIVDGVQEALDQREQQSQYRAVPRELRDAHDRQSRALVPTSFAPDESDDMLAAEPPQPVVTSASRGPGMMRVELPDDEPDDPYGAAERLAFTFLMQPTEFEFPGYEVPDPPAMPDIMPLDYGDDGISDAPIRLRRAVDDHVDDAVAGFGIRDAHDRNAPVNQEALDQREQQAQYATTGPSASGGGNQAFISE